MLYVAGGGSRDVQVKINFHASLSGELLVQKGQYPHEESHGGQIYTMSPLKAVIYTPAAFGKNSNGIAVPSVSDRPVCIRLVRVQPAVGHVHRHNYTKSRAAEKG